ncbi:MAG: DegV family protein [Clostridia bacterium]|nr:DegV family protein [Clostridia bacterium]
MFKIVSDSSCDIFNLDGVNFTSVPLKIIAGDNEYIDLEGVDTKEMIDFLKVYKGKSGSSCPSCADWLDAFDGADEIFAITITSGLSGSYNSACVAKDMYINKNPQAKVYVIDSLSAGPELTLIIEKIKELKEEGHSFDVICEKIEEYKSNTGLMFILSSLKNLANNGRVSHAVAAIANILGICLIGKASDEGTLEPVGKVRGEKKSVSALVKSMIENGYSGKKVIISHCFNEELASELKSKLLNLFESAQIKILKTGILCSFYAEHGGMLIGYEK